MSLRAVAQEWTLQAVAPPERGRTARLDGCLSPGTPPQTSRPPVDLNEVAERFLHSLDRGASPAPGDWNKIAWCLWTTRPAIVEHDRGFDAVLSRVARMESRRPYRQLASAYLTDFAPERPRVETIAGVLAACAARAGDPWSGAQTKYSLFGLDAPKRGAALALSQNAKIQSFLDLAGLGSAFNESGFAEAMHLAGLQMLRTTPIAHAGERLQIVRSWCFRPDDTLIFRNSRAAMARALVDPFGSEVPPDEDRDLILGFLVQRFGDPRVNPAGWIGMDDVADVLKRWLTEQSLRQFFEVVDRTVQQPTWKYRRQFWQAYYDQRLIRNAWVIFGPEGAAHARRSFGRDVRFGTFKGGGGKPVLRNHAVLLLDFGQCVVADWSHHGFCNVWPASDQLRPQNLTADRYTSDEVRRPVPSDRTEENLKRHDIFGHGGAENYIWQARVANRLYELIGVRVPPSAYRVR